MIELIRASRFVTPLREGGSLPSIVEASDLGTYVVKFRGAGQGLKALVAEVVVGELGRRLGLRVPDLRALELPAAIGRYEADEEVQDLLTASIGLNLAVDFLPGSFGWDAGHELAPDEAARVLWLDAFTANVDRSWRNPNLLLWHRELWLIDHGAALYFHHSWDGPNAAADRFARQPYDSSDHVLV
ncbi:MAG: HipA family kinase, partial [Jatrophihabitantaceae bacterium]